MISIVILCLISCVCGGDYGMVGLSSPAASRLLKLLTDENHRVAAYDPTDDSLAKAFMRKGAISAFSEEAVLKFAAPVVLVLDERDLRTSLFQHKVEGKVFVLWNRADGPETKQKVLAAAVIKGCSVVWGELSDTSASIDTDGHDALLHIPGLERLVHALAKMPHVADVDDAGHIIKRVEACPAQVPGAELRVERISAQHLGCSDHSLKVCRLYAKLADPADRLHVVAMYDVTSGITTDDPQGFYHAFNSSVVPLAKEIISLVPNGACDSFITMGVAEGHTCASPDPSFKSTDFLNEGKLTLNSGWFCGNPFTTDTVPNTAPKPPNTNDSILIGQFVVRDQYTVSGDAMIISANPAKKQQKVVQKFNCDCDYQ